MKIFTIYLANGKILRCGTCDDSSYDLQRHDNELIINSFSNPISQYVVNGIVTDLPAKPDYPAIFNYDLNKWESDYQTAENECIGKRKYLLVYSDWTQIPNGPLTEQQQQDWAVYRQELRDITSQSGYPFNVIWPTPPQG